MPSKKSQRKDLRKSKILADSNNRRLRSMGHVGNNTVATAQNSRKVNQNIIKKAKIAITSKGKRLEAGVNVHTGWLKPPRTKNPKRVSGTGATRPTPPSTPKGTGKSSKSKKLNTKALSASSSKKK